MTNRNVYGLITDNGDGSASIRWFRDEKLVGALLDQDRFYLCEGSPAQIFSFPQTMEWDEIEAIGFSFDDDDYDINNLDDE